MSKPIAIGCLIKTLLHNHHTKLNLPLQEVEPLLEKIVRVHGSNHPELLQVATIFESLKLALQEHLTEEEEVWFPHMMRLIDRKPIISKYTCCDPHHENSPAHSISEEHTAIKQLLERLHEATGGYKSPPDACGTYRRTFDLLKELESNILEQMHEEENVLIPEVKAQERTRTEHHS